MEMENGEIEITSWQGAVVVIIICALGFYMSYRFYFHYPEQKAAIEALKSDDPEAIARAVYKARNLNTAKARNLIPYALDLLGDERQVPGPLAKQFVNSIQVPSAFLSLGVSENRLENLQTIGHICALAIQGWTMLDITQRHWIGGRARKKAVDYLLDLPLDQENSFHLANALLAVSQTHDERLLPFWFHCLDMESESVKIQALSGLYYYIHDRTNGLFDWDPKKEIAQYMFESLEYCTEDDSDYVARQANHIIGMLKKAGLDY